MFWFKRKKIIVDAFVTQEKFITYSPIDKAAKFFPQWFKDTPSTYNTGLFETSTIKQCDGVLNMYRNSFIIPLWTDLALSAENGRLQYVPADGGETPISSHESEQWKTFVSPTEYCHLKLDSPWHLKTKENINWIFQQPFWNSTPLDPVILTPGMINYKYQSATNINMLINVKKNFKKVIPFNEPIIQIIPLTEKEVQIKHHVVSFVEWSNLKLPQIGRAHV